MLGKINDINISTNKKASDVFNEISEAQRQSLVKNDTVRIM